MHFIVLHNYLSPHPPFFIPPVLILLCAPTSSGQLPHSAVPSRPICIIFFLSSRYRAISPLLVGQRVRATALANVFGVAVLELPVASLACGCFHAGLRAAPAVAATGRLASFEKLAGRVSARRAPDAGNNSS